LTKIWGKEKVRILKFWV